MKRKGFLCTSSSYWIYPGTGSGFSRTFAPVIYILNSTNYDVEFEKKNYQYQTPLTSAYG
jgi:hypothetical protein